MTGRGMLRRAAAAAVGGLLLLGGSSAALAAETDGDDVDVSVEIAPPPPSGSLRMSVADDATTLAEVESTAGLRSFTGTLPTVTVTDDRLDVPADSFWYVTGQASDLIAAGGAAIPAADLGWRPALLSGDDGVVAAGEETVPALEAPTNDPNTVPNNVGLEGEEFLAISPDAAGSRPTGVWTANALLTLTTRADVAPGAYSGTITLTLWEDSFAE